MNDPQELVGNQDATITLHFSKLKDSDDLGDSNFLVGGRAYFEANVHALQTYKFTTKGFFDQEGYVEP